MNVIYHCRELSYRNIAMAGMKFDAFNDMSKLNNWNVMCYYLCLGKEVKCKGKLNNSLVLSKALRTVISNLSTYAVNGHCGWLFLETGDIRTF
jgi:hypothetical protein